MKKVILSAIAAASICLFSACSSDESEPTLAEKCANGLNEDCLVGTWTLKNIQSLDGKSVYFDHSSAPGTLIITEDGNFDFTYTTTTDAGISEMAAGGCAGTKVYGKWTVTGASLSLKVGRSDCLSFGQTFNITPTINESEMRFNTVVFHENDMTDALLKSNATEFYTRVAQ